LSHFSPAVRKLAGMGYQDREYMRDDGSGGGGRGSNPLWWILGLIALILIVSFFRRGATAPALQQAVQRAANVHGPMQTCRIELANGPPGERVLPVLRGFFREQGYDSTIHETADATLVSATFSRPSSNEHLARHAIYQHIGPAHKSLKPRHMLVFQVFSMGAAVEKAEHLEQSLEVSRQLRMRLEAELPGIIVNVDDEPRPAAYDEYE
jgi:hypothetical protein